MNWFVDLLDDLIEEGGNLKPEKLSELREARARLSNGVELPPRSSATDTLIAEIDEAQTTDQLAALFDRVPREYGFDDATFIVLREGKTCLSRRVISSLPDEWWRLYYKNDLAKHDPILKGMLSREHEIYLDEIIPTKDDSNPYLQAAEALHIGCNGVLFKLAYPSGLLAVMILNTVRTQDYVRRQYRKFHGDIHTVARAICDALVHFSKIGTVETAKLTTEEVHFLRLVALSENPSDALRMTCRFGSAKTVQNQIIRKLGVKSIFQAVLLASREGLFDRALLHPDEIIPTYPKITGWDVLDGSRAKPIGKKSSDAA